MDIFQTEHSRVEKRLAEYLLPLQDLGFQGREISKALYQAKDSLQSHQVTNNDECQVDLGKIKKQLNTYSDDAAILVKNMAGILTDIRYLFSGKQTRGLQ